MDFLITVIKTGLDNFARNKLRTFLTSLGILIGVASVVLLLALGTGLKNYIESQFESLGTNLLIVMPGKILQGGSFRSGPGGFGTIKFDERDVSKLKRVDGAEYVAPAFSKNVDISFSQKTENTDMYGTSEDMFIVRNLTVNIGRSFTKSDNNKRAKVAVMGPKIAEKLFSDPNTALGKKVTLGSQTFRIIGVLDSKGGGGFGGPDLDSFVYIPYKSGISFNPDKTFITLIIKAQNQTNIKTLKNEIETVLKNRYDEDDFSVIEQTEILKAITSIFAVLNSVLVLIGAISLIVGGIGIMNIMYVSVVERTKEIGIRRAIGATKQAILLQFLIESVLLSLTGGLGGLIVSYAITLIINQYFPAEISLMSVIIAFGVSTLIGVGFGVFPARSASNLSPIEAIRYE